MRFSRYVVPQATFKLLSASGDGEIRTLDPLLARQVLSQLSYTPTKEPGSHLPSHAVSSIVLSAVWGLTVVFGMGTGVSPIRIATRYFSFSEPSFEDSTIHIPLLLLP